MCVCVYVCMRACACVCVFTLNPVKIVLYTSGELCYVCSCMSSHVHVNVCALLQKTLNISDLPAMMPAIAIQGGQQQVVSVGVGVGASVCVCVLFLDNVTMHI